MVFPVVLRGRPGTSARNCPHENDHVEACRPRETPQGYSIGVATIDGDGCRAVSPQALPLRARLCAGAAAAATGAARALVLASRRKRARRARGAARQGRREAQGDPHPAAEGQDPHDLWDDAPVGRRVRADLELEVRDRLRAAAPGPRDGPRDPAAPRGDQGRRADVHPVPRGGRGDEGDAEERGGRGARGPRRAGARVDRRACGPRSLWAHRERAVQGARVRRVLPEPVQPAPGAALDGGRAMAALSPWMWIAGYALLVAATIFFPSP